MNPKQNRDFTEIKSAEPDSDGVFHRPLLVLDDRVVFPQVLSLVPIATEANVQAVSYAKEHNQTLIAVKRGQEVKDGRTTQYIYNIGTEIAPGQVSDAYGEDIHLLVQGRRRVRVTDLVKTSRFPVVHFVTVEEQLQKSERVEALCASLLDLFKHSSQYLESVPDTVIKYVFSVKEPGRLCDTLAAIMPLDPEQLQTLLEEPDVAQRLEQLSVAVSANLQDSRLHEEVHSRLQDEIAANQREMYLREQMRIIQQELGDGDIFQQELHELSEKIQGANLPEDIHEKAMKELSRLGVVPPMSPESGVIHTYLDRLLTLPWHITSEENLDLQHAQDILDGAHYGLREVKTRIIEHIAVRKLARDKMKSPILCFVGPPGVGKTSLGKSIADAIGCDASFCASASAGYEMRRRFAGTAGPISVRCRGAFCNRWSARKRLIRYSCWTRSTR